MLAALDAYARVRSFLRGAAPPTLQTNEEVQRILVVELWNIGDIVLTLPFLSQIRMLFPSARVTLVGRSYARELLEGTQLVDEFIQTDLGWRSEDHRWNPFRYRIRELLRVRREIQRGRFDIAFKARMHVREHALMAMSEAKRTVGFAFGKGDRVLTDPVMIDDPDGNKADDWLRLLEPFGGPLPAPPPRLRVSGRERQWAAKFLEDRGAAPQCVLVGVHPGASVPAKRWTLANFGSVARQLASRADVTPLIFIDPGGYGADLGEIEGVIPVRVGLRQMMALLERCRLVVCNDSGPMHIAGALGVPTVSIFGSGIKQWFAPLGEGHQLLSRDSSPARPGSGIDPYDVSRVTVSSVMTAIEASLDNAR